jgi:NAD(P)-dependent dehydrogenase (short-subunit alcohol dehydrogenase family)
MPTILITGANRGIGFEFARQYAADGWTVIATAREPSDDLHALGARVEILDLADAGTVAGFAGRIDGPIDLFIANAGTSEPRQPGGADDLVAWQRMMMVNTIAPYALGHALLPAMANGGKLVAISSGMGSIGDNGGGWVPYRTSKAALNMAWSSLALEARGRDLAIVALSPGWVQTRMGGSGADITAQESVTDMCALIERLAPSDSGKFLRRDGSALDW